jgi:hypothetical protein
VDELLYSQTVSDGSHPVRAFFMDCCKGLMLTLGENAHQINDRIAPLNGRLNCALVENIGPDELELALTGRCRHQARAARGNAHHGSSCNEASDQMPTDKAGSAKDRDMLHRHLERLLIWPDRLWAKLPR